MSHTFGRNSRFNFWPPASHYVPDASVSHSGAGPRYTQAPAVVGHYSPIFPPPVIPSNNLPLAYDSISTEVPAAPPQIVALDDPEPALIPSEPQAPPKEKRPLNGFIVFRRLEHRKAEVAKGSNINFVQGSELSRAAGEAWQALTDAERKAWCARAVEETRIMREQENAEAAAGGKKRRIRRPRKASDKEGAGRSKGRGKGKAKSLHGGKTTGSSGVKEAVPASVDADEEGRPAKRQRRTQPSKAGPSTAEKPTYESIGTIQLQQPQYHPSQTAVVSASDDSAYGSSRPTDHIRFGGTVDTHSPSPLIYPVSTSHEPPEGVQLMPQGLGDAFYAPLLLNNSPPVSYCSLGHDLDQLGHIPMVYTENPVSNVWPLPSTSVCHPQWIENRGLYDNELASCHQTSYLDLAHLSG